MTELFKNKYRVKSARLKGWDYSTDGHYFVTICTKDKKHYFGKVMDGEMRLSKLGIVAKECWLKIPGHFLHVELDEFVVMPNHIHGILILKNGRDGACPVSTKKSLIKNPSNHNFLPKPESLSVIVGSFKSAVSKHIKQFHPQSHFAWQSRFYDHIIHNEKSWYFMQEYIRDNPKNWERDKLFMV